MYFRILVPHCIQEASHTMFRMNYCRLEQENMPLETVTEQQRIVN